MLVDKFVMKSEYVILGCIVNKIAGDIFPHFKFSKTDLFFQVWKRILFADLIFRLFFTFVKFFFIRKKKNWKHVPKSSIAETKNQAKKSR